MSSPTVLITGASGHLGQKVLAHVQKNYKGKVIATTRSPDKLKPLAQANTEVRAADFTDINSLIAAFQGAERLLLISTDAVGSRVADHKNAIEAAKKVGVKHIIYTSYVNPEKAVAAVAPDHLQTEELIKASGLSYTFLRNNLYTENLIPTLSSALKDGIIYGVAGAGKTSYVTREDCAKAAGGALISEESKNLVIDVTGPEALSYDDVAAIASEIVGKKLIYQDLPVADYKNALVDHGLPEFVADLLASFDLTAKQGIVAEVSDAVKRFSGEEPESVANFLKRHLAEIKK